jgi:hypothetical protein
VAFDERFEALTLVLAAAHHVRVDPKGEGRIGVPELVHHVRRVPAERDRDRRERMAEFVRRFGAASLRRKFGRS